VEYAWGSVDLCDRIKTGFASRFQLDLPPCQSRARWRLGCAFGDREHDVRFPAMGTGIMHGTEWHRMTTIRPGSRVTVMVRCTRHGRPDVASSNEVVTSIDRRDSGRREETVQEHRRGAVGPITNHGSFRALLQYISV
jgi:hypothetical protein